MDHNTKASFLGGTFLSSIIHIGVEDIFTTTILAIIGAIISFVVSIVLKYMHKELKSRFKNK